MKVVILCGGRGTRMAGETEYRPKPLLTIDGKPMIWHIMKFYSSYGFNDFVLCIGYKGEMIKQYFMEMYWRNNDLTVHIDKNQKIEYHTSEEEENWTITIVDTGIKTETGGRLKSVEKYINEENFMFTYGDGLSDVNLNDLVDFHKSKNRLATLTGVHPVSNFGIMDVEDGIVKSFKEKPVLKDMVNGGYMVLNKKVFDYIEKDCSFEGEPLGKIAKDGELAVYEHNGFWKAVDTVKDVLLVENMCAEGNIPWQIWK